MSKLNGNTAYKGIILVFLLGLILPGFLGIFKTGRLVQEQANQDTRIARLEEAVTKLTEIATDIKVIKVQITGIEKSIDKLERK